MAAPHAAGLAALLVSGLAAERRPVEARRIRQALMVTARPLDSGSYLDDGTGQPDITAAWRWLATDRAAPDVRVVARGHGASAAFQERLLGAAADSVQVFDVSLPVGTPATEVMLRSSVAWLKAPARTRLAGGGNAVSVTYQPSALARPGVYTGVVTAWSADTLSGPVFRLVNTVVVADTAGTFVTRLGTVPAGGAGRVFFPTRVNRPFAVTFATTVVGEQVLAYLHEPGGQPFREENGIGAGSGDQAGTYVVDGRDVVAGMYEAVAVAPPLEGAEVSIAVEQSPLTIEATRDRDGVSIHLGNVTGAAVESDPFVVLVGAERTARIVARGSATERIRFQVPDWAIHAAVDVTMDREQWPRFTDFGMTLLDQDGRQIGKSPMNYALGRLHVDLPERLTHGREAEVALFPGFADLGGDQRWTATVSIRLYTDSAHVVRLAGHPVTVPAGASATLSVPMTSAPLKLGDAFVPLGIVVVSEGDRTWTREVPLPSPVTPLSQ